MLNMKFSIPILNKQFRKMKHIFRMNIYSPRSKKTLAASLIITFFMYFFYSYVTERKIRNEKLAELRFFKDSQKVLDTLNVTKCNLPVYDLYDSEILKYVKKKGDSILCEHMQPYLTYLDWNGTLFINKTELEINNYKNLSCTYEAVIGDKFNDYKVSYGKATVILKFPLSIEEPVIRVKCSESDTAIYVMIHSQIRPLDKHRIELNKAIPSHRPSMLIFIVDSMSRGNFIRTLPKTYKYLLENKKMDIFKGLNKVADNTFPNMYALLTGFTTYTREEISHIPNWNVKVNSTMKRYDDIPIIWNDYKKLGYVTMYAEEYLDATFSLTDVGFYDDPVDYYYRSSYVSLKQNLNPLNKKRTVSFAHWQYCLANEPSHRYVLNYTREFLSEMADYKYFAFNFLVEMSHDKLNDIKNMDDELYDFFKTHFDNGLFSNTILLVMGDHGHRFDGIRSTFIGRIEERMPFLGIILPEHLQKSHPHIKKSFESHSERLLSWYDIHETLVDFVLDDIGEEPKNIRPNAVGKSVLRMFDEDRTCSEIGILPEYCMCDRESKISISSVEAFNSAQLVIKKINELLKVAPNFMKSSDGKKCAHLTMKQVMSAAISMRSFTSGPASLLVRVVLETMPSEALFEAVVEYGVNSVSVLGDINRINKYGNQSSCIAHNILRLYCYCI